jgi:hypothetical protein
MVDGARDSPLAQAIRQRWAHHDHIGCGLEQRLHLSLGHCTAAHHQTTFVVEIQEDRVVPLQVHFD